MNFKHTNMKLLKHKDIKLSNSRRSATCGKSRVTQIWISFPSMNFKPTIFNQDFHIIRVSYISHSGHQTYECSVFIFCLFKDLSSTDSVELMKIMPFWGSGLRRWYQLTLKCCLYDLSSEHTAHICLHRHHQQLRNFSILTYFFFRWNTRKPNLPPQIPSTPSKILSMSS